MLKKLLKIYNECSLRFIVPKILMMSHNHGNLISFFCCDVLDCVLLPYYSKVIYARLLSSPLLVLCVKRFERNGQRKLQLRIKFCGRTIQFEKLCCGEIEKMCKLLKFTSFCYVDDIVMNMYKYCLVTNARGITNTNANAQPKL